MRTTTSKTIICLIMIMAIQLPAYCESLFRTGVSQNVYEVSPRSLYGTIKAKAIGDLVTVILEESTVATDSVKLSTSKTSSTTDNFSTLINKVLPGTPINKLFNGYGGNNTSSNTAASERKVKYTDTITAQVIQILPNGNLLVQGKKATVNAGESVNLIISGIIDPRFLTNTGTISSTNVANLQVAFEGEGTISRSNSEGPLNKFIRYLF